jgi:hypothetical protein
MVGILAGDGAVNVPKMTIKAGYVYQIVTEAFESHVE